MTSPVTAEIDCGYGRYAADSNMIDKMYIKRPLILAVVSVVGIVLPAGEVEAQGNIWGYLTASDLSAPPDANVHFFGLINNSDREVRVKGSIGIYYEGGFWSDDFQNYQNEQPGNPYSYYFFDTVQGEAAELSGLIPDNSFQQEDVELASAAFPDAPGQLAAIRQENGTIQLVWTENLGVSWHVYRREGSSLGSFFRIDDPSGNLAQRGVAVATFTDTDITPDESYSYVLIAESLFGVYSPPSNVANIDLSDCCQGLVGNVNESADDTPTIGDIALLVDHLFISYTPPACLREADVNQSGGLFPVEDDISIGDVGSLIDYLFIKVIDPPHCDDAGP